MFPFLEMGIVNCIRKNTAPICYHCGIPYVRDNKRSTELQTTWMPNCVCINKPGIKIVTG